MSKDGENIITVSVNLQDLAQDIACTLRQLAGKPIGFVLVVSVGKSAQYVSNATRPEGMGLLETVLDAWKNKRMDIDTYNNPGLNS